MSGWTRSRSDYALHRDDDLAVERRVDRLTPAVAAPRGDAREQHPQRPTWVVARALLGVEPDQVERIPLTQDVRSVARDAIRGRTHRAPFAAQRELDDACVPERDGGIAGPGTACGHPPDDTVAPDRLRVEPAHPRRLTHPIDRDRVRADRRRSRSGHLAARPRAAVRASSSAATDVQGAREGDRPGVAHRARDRPGARWRHRRGQRGGAWQRVHAPRPRRRARGCRAVSRSSSSTTRRTSSNSVRLGFELQWRDIEVLGARDGEAALDAVERERPDIVLLDVGPAGDGRVRGAAPDPRLQRRAGPDAHGARRRDGQGQGPRAWRRRLRHEAVQPPGADGPRPGRPAAALDAGRRRAARRRSRSGDLEVDFAAPGGPAARRARSSSRRPSTSSSTTWSATPATCSSTRRSWRRSGDASTSTRSTTYASTSAGYATSWATTRTIPATSARNGGRATGSSGPWLARARHPGTASRATASAMGACYKRSMGRAIRQLRESGSGDAPEVGGKAARLGELLAAGVRVPDGLRRWAWPMASLGRGRRRPPPRFGAAVRALGAGPFAVRSSAVGEDGDERSFAGMYESVLGVAPDDVPDAVDRVRASADGRVLAYDRAAGDRMAVIVQRMVVARAAGVALTADPITGDRRSCVVTAVRGLGERLVSGRTAGDEWVVRGRHATARRTPERAVTAREVRRIAIAARVIAATAGTPQDVEWAIDAAGRLWIVQARAMTALPPAMSWSSPAPGAYTRQLRFGEWISEPVTPLFESWLLTILEERLHAQLQAWTGQARATAPPRRGQRLVLLLAELAQPARRRSGNLPGVPGARHPRAAPCRRRCSRRPVRHGIAAVRARMAHRAAAAVSGGRRRRGRGRSRRAVAALPALIDELAALAGEYFASLAALAGAAYKMEMNLGQVLPAPRRAERSAGAICRSLAGFDVPLPRARGTGVTRLVVPSRSAVPASAAPDRAEHERVVADAAARRGRGVGGAGRVAAAPARRSGGCSPMPSASSRSARSRSRSSPSRGR